MPGPTRWFTLDKETWDFVSFMRDAHRRRGFEHFETDAGGPPEKVVKRRQVLAIASYEPYKTSQWNCSCHQSAIEIKETVKDHANDHERLRNSLSAHHKLLATGNIWVRTCLSVPLHLRDALRVKNTLPSNPLRDFNLNAYY